MSAIKQKQKKLSVQARVSNTLGVPFDMAMHRSYTTVCGNREAVIEDAGRLTHCGEGCIKVMQGKNEICITGNELSVKFLSNGALRVTGFLTNIGFERK